MTETSNTVLINDISSIRDLVTPATKYLFGPYLKIESIVEKSCISVSQRNSDTEVVSSICLDDCLLIPSVPRGNWLEWMDQIYNVNDLTYSNTMCVHLMVWSNLHQDTFLDHLLSYLYEHYHFLQHIILVLPQQIEHYSFILKHFRPMHKRSEWEQTSFSQQLHVNNRTDCIPQTQIKLAKLIDIDHILGLMLKKQELIKHTYKSQLIEDLKGYDKNRLRLVVTKNDCVIAFIILVGHDVDPYLKQDQFNESRLNRILFEANAYIRSKQNTASSESLLETHSCATFDECDSEFGSNNSKSPIAFFIDKFTIDNKYEYVIPEILEAAFQIYFTDSEYCMMTSDSVQNRTILNFLNPAQVSQDVVKKQDLYVISRVALLGDIVIRDGLPNDFNNMIALIENHPERTVIFKELSWYFKFPKVDSSYSVFVIMIEKKVIIGFVMLVTCMENKFIESYFQIQALCNYSLYQNEEQGLIKYFILSPPFMNRSRFIVKEILRVAEISSLYYLHYGGAHNNNNEFQFENENAISIIPDIIKTMFPIQPHIFKEYTSSCFFPNILQNTIFLSAIPPALYFINKATTCLAHKTCQVRILVSGLSTCGLSFIENMIFDRSPLEPCFTNITFISKHRIPYQELHYGELVDNMMPYAYGYTRHYMASLGLNINVIIRHGVMTEINVEDKYVIVDYKQKENFDYLFIFDEPEPKLVCKHLLMKEVAEEMEQPRTPNLKEHSKQKIGNLFCVGDRVEASRGLAYIKKMVSQGKSTENILIIGKSLCAYACVQNIISIGSNKIGSKIILAEGSDDYKLSPFFNNNELEQAMIEKLYQLGIQTLHEVQLIDYQVETDRSSTTSHITSVTMKTLGKLVTLSASAIFVFKPNCLEDTLSNVLRTAGVKVQEKILVDKNYQTNVPFIYAAGRSTQHSNKHSLDCKMHDFYNLREVGQVVSKIFKKFLNNNHEHENSEDFIQYSQCLVEYCVLPGGFNYIHVYEPGITTNNEKMKQKQINDEPCTIIKEIKKKEKDCTVIKTGEINEVKDNAGYFRILFDKNRFVKEITCVTQNIIHIGNTIKLYNKHSALLNNIIERHSVQPIIDLYSYFEQPWTMAIYNDKFNCLLNSIRKLFEKPNEEGVTINDIIECVHKEETQSNDADNFSESNKYLQEKKIRNEFLKFQTANNDLTKTFLVDAIMKMTVKFLEENSDDLPMYATPHLVEKLLQVSEDITTKSEHLITKNETLNIPRRLFNLPNTKPLSNSEIFNFMKLRRKESKKQTQKLMPSKMKESMEKDVKYSNALSRLRAKKKEQCTIDDLIEDMVEDPNYF